MAFDLDKVIDEQDGGEPFTFTFDGYEYLLPSSLDTFAIAAITDGQMFDGLRRLLGDEQYERIDASEKPFSIKALDALLNEYARHMGLDSLGESSASPRLSNRTARRSKPTSNGGTKSGSRSSVVR